jgi:hypothetical protein
VNDRVRAHARARYCVSYRLPQCRDLPCAAGAYVHIYAGSQSRTIAGARADRLREFRYEYACGAAHPDIMALPLQCDGPLQPFVRKPTSSGPGCRSKTWHASLSPQPPQPIQKALPAVFNRIVTHDPSPWV